MVEWLDTLQRRNRAAGIVIAVIYKYLDDQAGYLAAMITYYAFVSLFPLLLLLTTVLGVVLAGHPDLQQQIMHSALSQFPVIGDQLGQPRRLSGGIAGVIVGVGGALYGGLGVGQALQNAMDTVWAVPRNTRPDPLRSRVRSLLLLVFVGGGLGAVTVLSAASRGSALLGLLARAAVLTFATAITAAVFVLAFKVTTARELSWRQIAPGALTAAVLWQLLQWGGGAYVGHVVKSASATNSVFALVLGLLAFFYLISVVILLCAEVNVVVTVHLYPRALLAPFTDAAALTPADQKTYAGQAKAQRVKDCQDIDVSFEIERPDNTR